MVKWSVLGVFVVLLVVFNIFMSIDATLKLRACKKHNVEQFYE